MSVSQAVARQEQNQPANKRPENVYQLLKVVGPELAKALPKGMDAERMQRIILTEVRKTPQLAECDVYSFSAAILTAAALGLEPGLAHEAYLIPFEKPRLGTVECTLIVGYHGLVKLFHQHPLAMWIDAQPVYPEDDFDWARGTDPFLRHKPAMPDGEVRPSSDVIAYYAVAALTNGARPFVVLSPEQVKALRQGKVGPDSRFKGGDPMKWMERKTAIRQLVKLLPKTHALQRALDVDEKTGSELRILRQQEADPSGAVAITDVPAAEAITAGDPPEPGPAGPADDTKEPPGWEPQ